jgi:hypothetical protein
LSGGPRADANVDRRKECVAAGDLSGPDCG